MSRFGKLSKLMKKKESEEPKEEKDIKKQILEEGKEDVDSEAISKIVDRMKDKYIKEGVLTEDEQQEKTRLRIIMAGESERIRPDID